MSLKELMAALAAIFQAIAPALEKAIVFALGREYQDKRLANKAAQQKLKHIQKANEAAKLAHHSSPSQLNRLRQWWNNNHTNG